MKKHIVTVTICLVLIGLILTGCNVSSSSPSKTESSQTNLPKNNSDLPSNSDGDAIPIKDVNLDKIEKTFTAYLKERFTQPIDVGDDVKKTTESKYFAEANMTPQYASDYLPPLAKIGGTETFKQLKYLNIRMQPEKKYQYSSEPKSPFLTNGQEARDGDYGLAYVKFTTTIKLNNGEQYIREYAGVLGFKTLYPENKPVLISYKLPFVIGESNPEVLKQIDASFKAQLPVQNPDATHVSIMMFGSDNKMFANIYDIYNDRNGIPHYARHEMSKQTGTWTLIGESDALTGERVSP